MRVRYTRRSGYSIVELMIATTLFVVVMVSSLALMERDAHLSKSTLSITAIEDQSTQMLYRIERELADGLIDTPKIVLGNAMTANETGQMVVADTLGFPPSGLLVVSRGRPNEEIIAYSGIDPTVPAFTGLTRAQGCTQASAHPASPPNTVYWIGLAEPIANQTNPPAASFDGVSDEEGLNVFYVGRGSGISYRIPVDPAGGTNVLNGEDIQWGTELGGTQITSGWAAIQFVAVRTVDESVTGDDINKDGDRGDVFDVGQLRRRLWDTANPGAPVEDLGLGPTAVLQERCNWGGDLDADGSSDPIFLWDPTTRQLHIRLFLFGQGVKDMPIVRRIESVMFLRNESGL